MTKSLALGAKVPPVAEEVQTPEAVPPETVPLSKISEFKQIALGAEVVTRTPGEISITLSFHYHHIHLLKSKSKGKSQLLKN